MAQQPTTPQGSGRLAYRPDVQGIRALAVMVVVLNHLFPGLLPGGFVGVDVFLVISGYLITALMLREAESSGRISLADFYARRARRILPAATVVIVVTVLLSLATLALLRTRTVLSDAVWSTFFLGNVRMAQVGTDYFAQDAPPSPLRHYWSLAVEEQFYLVWPLLLALLVAWSLRRFGTRRPAWRGAAVGVLLLVVIASVAWSVWSTANSPTTAYYSTFTRAHELALGALLAFLPATVALPRGVREGLGVAGLLGVLVACFAFSDETAFPGVAALLPVLATMALVLAGQAGQEGALGQPAAVTRLLGVRGAVAIGDWSYSLYLWHWPAIVIVGAWMGASFTAGPKLVLLAGVLLLSWASYHWIENPFRRARVFRSTRRGIAVYPASVLTALAVVLASQQIVQAQLGGGRVGDPVVVADLPEEDRSEDPLADLVRASVEATEAGREIPGTLTPSLDAVETTYADLGGCNYPEAGRKLCAMGDVDAERDIVVLGDSLARAMSPAAVRIGEEYGYRVHVLGMASCPSTSLVQVERGTKKPWKQCEDFKKWAMKTIADIEPELVLVSTSSNSYFDPTTKKLVREADSRRYERLIRRGWEKHFAELKKHGQRVVAVGRTPRLEKKPGECLTDGDPTLAECTFAPAERSMRQASILFRAAKASGAEVLDASRWFCYDGRCPMVVGEYITLLDTHHVTPPYAQQIAEPMARLLGLERSEG